MKSFRPSEPAPNGAVIVPFPRTRTFADPATLRATRHRRAIPLQDLADELGQDANFISRAETKHETITGSDLAAYAAALNVTEELLATPIPQHPPQGCHLDRQSPSAPAREQLIAHANYAAWLLNRLHEHTVTEAMYPRRIYPFDIDEVGSPEQIARIVRGLWNIRGPITDIARLIEGTGIIILPMPTRPDLVAAATAVTVRTTGPIPAVILLNQTMTHDRQRHTLAHVLGHLVMDAAHPAGRKQQCEEHANRFAAELLAPYAEIRTALHQITPSQLPALEDLRRTWGVSLPVLIRRAYTHRAITAAQYQAWIRNLTAGNSDVEPSTHPVLPDDARLFLQALSASRYSVFDISEITMTEPRELQHVFGELWPFAWMRPTLTVV